MAKHQLRQLAKCSLTLTCTALLTGLGFARNGNSAGPAQPRFSETQAGKTQKPDEIRAREVVDLKWGMYLCWSFCCFSGKQWTPNVSDIALFSATRCDTDQWARTAREAGMGYICFLTKHHDGFCLWDTDTSERKVTR
jgi:hypothetical protein